MQRTAHGAIIIAAIAVPLSASAASVRVSEVMYDPSGADDKREWIEVENLSSASLDLSAIRFAEGGTNHKLTLFGGGEVPAGGFAVIADDAASFLADHPLYSGALYDSSFSLSNQGELLELKEGDLILDAVSYAASPDADGTGYSLHRSGGGFLAAPEGPGAPPAAAPASGAAAAAPEPSARSVSAGASGGTVADPIPPKIRADAGSDVSGIAGAPVSFAGSASIGSAPAPDSSRYLWNFGDGTTFIGRATSHTYSIPGRYVVSLSVSSGDESVTDVLIAEIRESSVAIAAVVPGASGHIRLRNGGSSAADLSGWILSAAGESFIFPKGTFIAPGAVVPFSAAVTGLVPVTASDVELFYPSGARAAAYQGSPEESPVVAAPSSPAKAVSATPTPSQKSAAAAKAPPPKDPIPPPLPPIADESLPAGLALAGSSDRGSSGVWYLAFAGVLALGAAGAALVERKRPVDEYEIVE